MIMLIDLWAFFQAMRLAFTLYWKTWKIVPIYILRRGDLQEGKDNKVNVMNAYNVLVSHIEFSQPSQKNASGRQVERVPLREAHQTHTVTSYILGAVSINLVILEKAKSRSAEQVVIDFWELDIMIQNIEIGTPLSSCVLHNNPPCIKSDRTITRLFSDRI